MHIYIMVIKGIMQANHQNSMFRRYQKEAKASRIRSLQSLYPLSLARGAPALKP